MKSCAQLYSFMDIGPASSQIFLSFTCMIGTTGFVELEQNISSASNNSLSVISHSSKGISFDSIRWVKNFLVIPGSGSGTDAQAPVMVVIDTENPSKLFKTLVP